MASYVPPKKNTEFIMYLGLPSASDSAIYQANPTLAAGDVTISKDGGALANVGTLPAVTPASSKLVKLLLSATEMNADNVTVIFSDQTASEEWNDVIVNIQTSARQIDDLAFPNTSGRGMDIDASGGVEVGTFQTGAITSGAFTAGAIDAAAVAADAGTEIGTAVWATAARTLTALDEDSTTIDIDNSVWGGGTRTLTALDEDSTTLDLDATIRAAVGLATANLDTQLDDLPTNAELTTALGTADDAVLAAIDNLPTNAELATALGTADDATLSAIAALDAKVDIIDSNVDSILVDTGTTLDGKIDTIDTVLDALVADIGSNGSGLTAIPWNSSWDTEVESEVVDGLTLYDAATGTDVSVIDPPTAQEIADAISASTIDVNIVQVDGIPVNGAGTDEDPWGPVG